MVSQEVLLAVVGGLGVLLEVVLGRVSWAGYFGGDDGH